MDRQKTLGPTRGGGEILSQPPIRDIEYDSDKGKNKRGMQVVDDITAQLNVTSLMSLEALEDAPAPLPSKYDQATKTLTVDKDLPRHNPG